MGGTDGERALPLARAVLAAAPAGLLTDFDGTLSPIVADPATARPLPGAVDALAELAERVRVVAVVSGRAALDARRLLGSDRVMVIGNHGLEWLEPGAREPTWDPGLRGAAGEVERLAGAVPLEPGVRVERKGLSATVHVRNAPDPEAARRRVLGALEPVAGPAVVIRPGRMSLELRPAGAGDKGSAVRSVAGRYGLRGLLVLGDDVTDLDMFRAARELGEEGASTAVIGVGGAGEVPAEVAAAADAMLPDPAAVVELLQALAAEGSGTR